MNAVMLALSATIVAASSQTPSLDVLKRALDPNPALTSYVASASLAAELHGIVPLHKTLTGVAYYLKPKHKIVFEDVPGPFARFKELVTATPTYDEARAEFTITPLADDGTASTYLLVPSKSGRRVKSVKLVVDDQAADIVRVEWMYTDGGRLSFQPAYTSVGAFRLAVKEDISARFPGYSVDGTLRLSDYQLDASVPTTIFGEKK